VPADHGQPARSAEPDGFSGRRQSASHRRLGGCARR
jgi:hypothetical protein